MTVPPRPVILALAALSSASPALAASPDKGLSIRPEIGVSLVWDDNVYHEKHSPEADWATGISPRVAVDYRRGRLRTGADVGADVRLYNDHSELNETFWRTRAYVEFEPARGLLLRLSDTYAPQPIRLGRPEDDTDNLRQSNTLLAEARYWRELKRDAALEIGIRSSRFTTDGFPASIDVDGDGIVEDRDRLTSDHWDVSSYVEGQYFLGRRTRLFARAAFVHRRYDEISASDFQEFSGIVGVRRRWARRLSLEFAVGYGRIAFDEGSTDGRFIGRLDIDYPLGKGWSIRASLLRRLSGDATGTDFSETSARLGVEKRLGARTSVSAGVWWSQFEDDALGRGRNRVIAGELRVRRRITRRIEAELAYRHWRNRGRVDQDDFSQNRVTIGLVYRY